MTDTIPPTDVCFAALNLVHSFGQALDDGRLEEAAAMFAQDGYWVRLGEKLQGPEAVLNGLRGRPATLRTRHLITNMVLAQDGKDVVSARYYMTVFDHVGDGAGPAPLSAPGAIFLCTDLITSAPQGWRFASREPKLVFKRP